MQVSNYGIEEIPDTARLYYRVHKNIYMATVKAAGTTGPVKFWLRAVV